MSVRIFVFILVVIHGLLLSVKNPPEIDVKSIGKFNVEKDLLLAQFDCKTDVDDLHTVAAFSTLMSQPTFSNVNFHAVTGTYGIQDGLYVPPNTLFELAFDNEWTDAHQNFDAAIKNVTAIVEKTLSNQGTIWIAEAGQSNFTAALVKAVQVKFPEINTKNKFHVVQHSEWNESVTAPESLNFVKNNVTYHKIPDGNEVGNGTPGFQSADFGESRMNIKNQRLADIWKLAITLGNKYNGKDGRYNNKAVAAGGLDFSDLSEVCWIFGLNDIKDTASFFEQYSK
jgi:hypothetical protein